MSLRHAWFTSLALTLLLLLPLESFGQRGGGARGGGGGGARGGGGGFGGGAGGGGGARGGGGGFGGGAGDGARGGGGFGGGGDRGGGGFGGGGGDRGGGGFGGGGLGGGDRSGGGFGGGDRGGGGFGGGDRSGGGFGGQAGAGEGGFNRGGQGGGFGGGAGQTPSRGELNSFLGMPSDEGMPGLGSRGSGNQSSAAAGAAFANRNSPQYSGGQGAAAGAAAANRNSPQYSGGQGAAAGAAVANRNSPQYSGAQGAAAGAAVANRNSPQYSGAAGYAAGFNSATASNRYTAATSVRSNFNNYNLYGAAWQKSYPGAWAAAGWTAGAAWRPATWSSVGAYCGYPTAQPVYYDYGNNVTYQDNSVYVNGQSAGTSQEYYQQAATLAQTGTAAQAPSDGDWLPLGVFSMSKNDHPSSNLVIQLAVNKEGVIRGNYTDTLTNQTQPVHGSVDKTSQRAAFTVGDNTTTVVETGVYNLTKDEAPALMHFGQDRTEQWLLVRLKNQDAAATQ